MKKELVKIPEKIKKYIYDSDTDLKIEYYEEAKVTLVTFKRINGIHIQYVGLVFTVRANKAKVANWFVTEEKRDCNMKKVVNAYRLKEKVKKEERFIKNNFEHSVKVGDLFVSSWGYNQTNVDFYQVLGLKGKKTLLIREVNINIVDTNGSQDFVVPVRDSFSENEVIEKRLTHGNRIRISSYASACLWDGKPKYQTGWGFGH